MPVARTLRFGLVVSALAALSAAFPAAPAAARDRLAPGFKKATKTALTALKTTIDTAIRQAKAGVRTPSRGYADASLGAAEAVHNAVAAITALRDTVEDAAVEVADRISADGSARLAGVTDPGPDFQAGGRGIWDDALRDIESLLDKADVQFDLAFGKFVTDMKKAAGKSGNAIDVRYRVPPHGEGFLLVVPPFQAQVAPKSRPKAGPLDVAPPQILIAARFAETNRNDQLVLGIRGLQGAVDVKASSSATELVLLGSPTLDADGIATTSFPLEGVLSNESFLRVKAVNALAVAAEFSKVTLSQPRIQPVGGNTATIVKDFTTSANREFKFFGVATAQALLDYNKKLASHLLAVAQRRATPDQAVAEGLNNLVQVRATILSVNHATANAPVVQAAAALTAGGFVDSEIPAAIVPDGNGYFAGMGRKWAAMMAVRQATVTAKFDTFVGNVTGLAGKQGFDLDINAVLGRDGPDGLPMITLSPTPTDVRSRDRRYTDVLVVRTNPGTPALRAELIVQADPATAKTSELSYVNIADGSTVVVGGLLSGPPGGVAKKTVPLLGNIPLLGHLFRAGRSTDNQRALLVIVTPSIVGP